MDLNGKKVFVTGGMSGIGLRMAELFAGRGAHLAIFDLRQNPEAEKQISAARRNPGQLLRTGTVDVSDSEAVRSEFAKAAAELGAPDLVFNSAGIVAAKILELSAAEEFENVIRVNLFGSRNVAAAAIPLLKPGGKIVLVASLAGLVGSYGYTAYSASKFGVFGLAESLRVELKPKGIEVAVVCPPEVDTPMVHYERTVRPRATEALKLFAGTLTVDEACSAILKGVESGRFIIIPGARGKLTWYLAKLLPRSLTHRVSDSIVAKALKKP